MAQTKEEMIVVEEVLDENGVKRIGNSELVPESEARQRVICGGWKVQGLPIGKLPESVVVDAAGGAVNGRD